MIENSILIAAGCVHCLQADMTNAGWNAVEKVKKGESGKCAYVTKS